MSSKSYRKVQTEAEEESEIAQRIASLNQEEGDPADDQLPKNDKPNYPKSTMFTHGNAPKIELTPNALRMHNEQLQHDRSQITAQNPKKYISPSSHPAHSNQPSNFEKKEPKTYYVSLSRLLTNYYFI